MDKYYLFNGDIILFDSNCTDEDQIFERNFEWIKQKKINKITVLHKKLYKYIEIDFLSNCKNFHNGYPLNLLVDRLKSLGKKDAYDLSNYLDMLN